MHAYATKEMQDGKCRLPHLSPLIQPLIPSSLTVIVTGSGSCDLYLPFSSKYRILGFMTNVPFESGLTTIFTSSVLSGFSFFPSG